MENKEQNCEHCQINEGVGIPKCANHYTMENKDWREEFWKMLEANQFVKSTNSITDQVEEYPPAIQDMEATVRINGEFDKYAIDEWLTTSINQALAEDRERVVGYITDEEKLLKISKNGAEEVIMNLRTRISSLDTNIKE